MSSVFFLSPVVGAHPPGPVPDLHPPHSQKPGRRREPGEGLGAQGTPEA